MKFTAIFTVILSVTNLFSQKQFSISSRTGTKDILINGKAYKIDNTDTRITTRYPQFDTLVFLSEAGSGIKIVCNFKPDSSYAITLACCGSLDIIPQSKFRNDSLKYWDVADDLDKIKNQLLDRPFLSIRTKKAPRDSIYAWHADPACGTEHKLINTELWSLGIPPKCYYWSNITTILFFKTDARSKQKQNKDIEGFVNKTHIVDLATIHLRLFDNQRFILTFDEKEKNVTLTYE